MHILRGIEILVIFATFRKRGNFAGIYKHSFVIASVYAVSTLVP